MDKTKEKILQVATRIFTRFGFHKTTIDEIARTSRKAKGSVYYYFTSKEDLFSEVVKRELSHIRNELNKIVDSDLACQQKIKDYIITRMQLMLAAANYHETLRADFFEQFEFLDQLRSDFDTYEKNAIEKMLKAGILEQKIRPLENLQIVSEMFMMILKGLEIPFYLQGKYEAFRPHVDYLMNIVMQGFAINTSDKI